MNTVIRKHIRREAILVEELLGDLLDPWANKPDTLLGIHERKFKIAALLKLNDLVEAQRSERIQRKYGHTESKIIDCQAAFLARRNLT